MSRAVKQPPIVLHGNERLHSWIEAGGRPDRPVKLRALRHRWFAFWSMRHQTMTSRKCGHVALPPDPVFILGLWRTGSTVLHSALSRATGWTTPLTWQCFRPTDFLLLPAPSSQRASRPMDVGIIDTYSPQEDEFASLLLGEPSTYRAFIDPRRIGELSYLLDAWRTSGTSTVAPLSEQWETFLRAVLYGRPVSNRLLLKSPNHTFRLPWLARRFPNAQFIWLTRDRSDVLQSNEQMWALMAERYGQWALTPSDLKRYLIYASDNHDEILDWARQAIPERVHLATFSEAIHQTSSLVDRILGFLGASQDQSTALLTAERHDSFKST